jgi:prepilin-type processing-associated H-X9-DG protein
MTLERVIAWSCVGLIGAYLALILISPSGGLPKAASQRSECRNHLRQLALAMHRYHDTYGAFPPAHIADENGEPMHSWRVLLLPYLDHRDLYNQYHFDEPWDGPHNRTLAEQMQSEFHCSADTQTGTNETSYFVVVGPKTIFPGTAPVPINDVLDGTTYTILLVESLNSGTNWLQPRDLSYDEARRGINRETSPGISSNHEGGAMVAFADGSEELLPDNTPLEQLRLLLERNDGRPSSAHRPDVPAPPR